MCISVSRLKSCLATAFPGSVFSLFPEGYALGEKLFMEPLWKAMPKTGKSQSSHHPYRLLYHMVILADIIYSLITISHLPLKIV